MLNFSFFSIFQMQKKKQTKRKKKLIQLILHLHKVLFESENHINIGDK